jgi:hypothetical protein
MGVAEACVIVECGEELDLVAVVLDPAHASAVCQAMNVASKRWSKRFDREMNAYLADRRAGPPSNADYARARQDIGDPEWYQGRQYEVRMVPLRGQP